MPRQSRLDYPGTMHHVIGRGIERRNIFKKNSEKAEFQRRVSELLKESSMQCYAWCIMDNHFHLLLLTGQTKLSHFMRRLLTGYAVYYNMVNKRAGHLFQNRYKSILCDKDEYLLSLIRYIHLNPVRVKLIEADELRNYKWTGHRELLSKSTGYKIIDNNEVLSYFGEKEEFAKREYIKFVNAGVDMKEDYAGGGLMRSVGGKNNLLSISIENKQMYDERILGGGDFVEEVLSRIERKDKRDIKVNSLEKMLFAIGSYYKVETSEIIKGSSKEVRRARCVLVFAGTEYLGKSITEMGKILGVKQPAGSIAKKKGEKFFKEDNLEKIF